MVVANGLADLEMKAKIEAFKDEKKREKMTRMAAAVGTTPNPDSMDTT
jgi:hypothetical protein